MVRPQTNFSLAPLAYSHLPFIYVNNALNLSNVQFFKHLEENSSYLQQSYLGTSIFVLFYGIRWSMTNSQDATAQFLIKNECKKRTP